MGQALPSYTRSAARPLSIPRPSADSPLVCRVAELTFPVRAARGIAHARKTIAPQSDSDAGYRQAGCRPLSTRWPSQTPACDGDLGAFAAEWRCGHPRDGDRDGRCGGVGGLDGCGVEARWCGGRGVGLGFHCLPWAHGGVCGRGSLVGWRLGPAAWWGLPIELWRPRWGGRWRGLDRH
jgi:hypothetical protein